MRRPAELAADAAESDLATDGDMHTCLEIMQQALPWWPLSS